MAFSLAAFFVQTLMELDCLDHLRRNPQEWIERGHRILENHRYLVAAYVADFVRRHLEQVFAMEQNLSARNFPWRYWDEIYN